MIRIGRIVDQITVSEQRKMAEVQAIFRKVFTGVPEYADRFPQLLTQQAQLGFEIILLTAENVRDHVFGFALVHYYPDLHYGYLDYLASDPGQRTTGIGGAL